MKRPPEKHLGYFTVIEALRERTGCPFCGIEIDGGRRYLSGILDEHVNDPGVRQTLARARGYCPRHAHQLLSFGGALGTAILYMDQVGKLREELERMAPARRTDSTIHRAMAQWTTHKNCPACRHQLDERERAVSVLIESVNEPEMRTAYEAASLVCLPHFRAILGAVRDSAIRHFLIREQQRKLESLEHDLHEFCRKQDYRFRHEPVNEERDAWRRAVAAMTGEAGAF